MDANIGHILILAKHPRQVRVLISLLESSNFSVALAWSEEQARMQAKENPPFLVIFAGDHHSWSCSLLQDFRARATVHHITLIALTDFHSPSWIHQEENPGFDGFLVNPITSEVLFSLVQSAHTRQVCA